MVLFEALLEIYILQLRQTTSVSAITFITSSAELLLHSMHDITICYFLSRSPEKTLATLVLCVTNVFQHF